MSANEHLSDCKVCCARSDHYAWDIEREQVTGLAVVDCETQLLGVSSETIDKVNMKKSHGFSRPWIIGCMAWTCGFIFLDIIYQAAIMLPLSSPLATLGTSFCMFFLVYFSSLFYSRASTPAIKSVRGRGANSTWRRQKKKLN